MARFNDQQPAMTWSVAQLGAMVSRGLAAGIGVVPRRTLPQTAATHWHRYVIPVLVLLATRYEHRHGLVHLGDTAIHSTRGGRGSDGRSGSVGTISRRNVSPPS